MLTFFFERLAADAMGRRCDGCGAWRERADYSKKQCRRRPSGAPAPRP